MPALVAALLVSAGATTAFALAPPFLAKNFGVETIPTNATTYLRFQIANFNSISLSGIGFTDVLPSGLVVSTPNGVSGSCGGTVTAIAGTNSISLSGATVAKTTTCTFFVNVTATFAAGFKTNVTGPITSSNSGPGNTATAYITVISPPAIYTGFLFPGGDTYDVPINRPFTLSFSIFNSNTASVLSGVGFTDILPPGLVIATPNGLTGTCDFAITATPGSASFSASGGLDRHPYPGSDCGFSVDVIATTVGVKVNTTSAITSTEGGNGAPATGMTTVLPATTHDFNADGTSDIVFHNSSSGAVVGWLMNGSTVTSSATIATVPPTGKSSPSAISMVTAKPTFSGATAPPAPLFYG
jgi:hypothetical protein